MKDENLREKGGVYKQPKEAEPLDLPSLPEEREEDLFVEDKYKVKLNTTPPQGSNLDSFRYSNSIMEIVSPKEGLSKKVRGPLLFGMAWLGFIALWTLLALGGGYIFVLFSIPFWSSGISMIYSVTKTIFEEQKFELNGRTLTIQKNRLLNSREEELDLAFIQSIKLESPSTKKRVTGMADVRNVLGKKSKIPTITLKNGSKETLLENGTQAEKIWLVSLLNEYMKEVIGTDELD